MPSGTNAGLRPGEALALTWGDVGVRTLAIDKAVKVGEEGPTKTGGVRSTPLVEQLASDLADLRVALIARAREAVIELERRELDEMMADLIEHPAIGGAPPGSSGGEEGARWAARAMYSPSKA